MTEQPDTAVIRAQRREWYADYPHIIASLCDALDAARAGLGLSINALVAARAEVLEIRSWMDDGDDAFERDLRTAQARAEAAEARIEWLERERVDAERQIEATEARIFKLQAEKEAVAALGLKQWSRAEAAEARIAIALIALDCREHWSDRIGEARRALTEGTTP